MPLHTLGLSGNKRITYEGIKGMRLHTLNLIWNITITNEIIKTFKDI